MAIIRANAEQVLASPAHPLPGRLVSNCLCCGYCLVGSKKL